MAGPARAQTDIAMTCYTACEKSTHSNPEYKACLARAADKADRALNESYRALQTAIRDGAKAMGEKPDIQLGALTIAQKAWIAYRDANCSLEEQARLWRHRDRRQCLGLSLHAQLPAHRRFRAHAEAHVV
jgi:uncharacterized protein YecT (DUF1311 family)